MDDKVTKAMTYGGCIIAFSSMVLFSQALQSSSNFESGYTLFLAYVLITSTGFALALLGVLLGNTGTFTKTIAIIGIVVFIVIIAMHILVYYRFLQSSGAG